MNEVVDSLAKSLGIKKENEETSSLLDEAARPNTGLFIPEPNANVSCRF